MNEGMTPFAKRMAEFNKKNAVEVKSFSPVLLGEGKEPMVGEGRAPLMGDTKPTDPNEIERLAEDDQLNTRMESSRDQITQASQMLRQKVASGELSEADAEHQLDLLVNKITDNSYMGWGDLDMRQRAAQFGDKAGDAYGMYGMGLDPAMMARQRDVANAERGVLSEPMLGTGIEPPIGEGKEPLMGMGGK